MKEIYLKIPNLSKENILGYATGVRPFRKSGIRIETEYLNDKLIVHNYGYGGSGLTLCWGGAKEAINILNQEKINNPEISTIKTIAVLGAGIIGITTAYDLLANGYQVSIYADKFSPHLTSNVAAGYLGASSVLENASEEQIKLINRMLNISIQKFLANAKNKDAEFLGSKFLIDYRFEDNPKLNVLGKPSEILAKENNVRVHFDNGITKIGKQAEILGLDGKIFIDDLYRQIKAMNVTFKRQLFKNKNDIANLSERIIMNCTSIGSRTLFNDDQFLPIRGHLIHIKNQEGVDYSMYHALPQQTDYWVMLYPWKDRLILGGVSEKGLEENIIDPVVINKLLKNASDFFKKG